LNFLTAFWQKWWGNHGTKILGFGATVIGVAGMIDRATIDEIGKVFGPKYGPLVVHALIIVGGLLVAKRGFTNSRKGP
jgi:hypothetical protein